MPDRYGAVQALRSTVNAAGAVSDVNILEV